jgi:TM2 domain-containing membrane protein YozV
MLAAFLSLVITGAGQLYLGEIARGIIYLGAVLLISITLEGVLTYEQMLLLGIVISIISAWDAYRLAKAMNK